jgi:hypothetical protein
MKKGICNFKYAPLLEFEGSFSGGALIPRSISVSVTQLSVLLAADSEPETMPATGSASADMQVALEVC